MIIGSSIEWPIGSLQHGINEHTDQPFVVLRQATREEWVAEHMARVGYVSPISQRIVDGMGLKYYEVSVD